MPPSISSETSTTELLYTKEKIELNAPRYGIFVKKYYSTTDIENSIISRLNRTDLLYQFIQDKSLEIYENHCDGKDWKECEQAYQYRSAAYVLLHTIQVSLFTRFDLGKFLTIDDKVTHLIIVLPARSYSGDQLSFSVLPNKMNVTIVGISHEQHSLDLIGGNYLHKVDRLYLESIDSYIYARGNLQVGSVVLDTSSYSDLFNTYTIKSDVPILMNAYSLSKLRYTQADDVFIFSNTNKIDKVSFDPKFHIYSRSSNYSYYYLPATKVQTIYTTSDFIELNFDALPSTFLTKFVISY